MEIDYLKKLKEFGIKVIIPKNAELGTLSWKSSNIGIYCRN